MRPLEGLRVLDLSRLLPGPFATLVLADLGADVVLVEDPRGGDALRRLPPLAGEASGAFHALNRNKCSVALDVRRPEGAAVFLRLARRADVVVESFRPGVLEGLGLGWTALRAANPRLVLCSITGYGQDGPYAARAGHDVDYLAVAGVLGLTGEPERPAVPGVQVADLAGGSWPAVAGILAALLRRATTGEGAHVDVSMAEGAVSLMTLPLAMAWARGTPLERGRELLSGGAACYGVYRTSDGRFVALGALEPKFFAAFCAAAGRPELAPRQFEAGGAGPRAELEALFASRTRDEWAALAAAHDVCLAPVLEGDEPRSDPHLVARGAFVQVPTPWEGRAIPGIATPVRLRGEQAPLAPAPRLGEHGESVLREAGFGDAELAELRAAGVLGE
ncbi:CaiB/BaiF CoA-transferase family protein [Anaeromyxobacter sp. Fw109-5]|uniref:CaiB/BaiF CoA transferase family protein n=1 Tax=Anaeromyxobacter sp. (strain Fw109-5) TaxID=404589 RepID=UPI0000ED7E01|nr:CaiB/BaiF CoA-transferase family protein [Anaeromyxobacter sp. Fw109-5]ABS25738.1 L-carnitine dehydratase/bile acid-inducible protein F [Anaeromyxobacter sp. Fw109-5]